MKKAILFVFTLLILRPAYSQEILIPYRAGKLWGLCDTSGQVKLTPVYDDVLYEKKGKDISETDLPPGFFVARKGEKYGILKNKEIIPAVYDEVNCFGKKFFVARTWQKPVKTYYFTMEGKPLFPAGVGIEEEIWTYEDNYKPGESKTYTLFICADSTGKKGVFLYNSRDHSRSSMLIKGYHSVRPFTDFFSGEEIIVEAQKTPDGPVKYFLIGYDTKTSRVAIKKTSEKNDFHRAGAEIENDMFGSSDIAEDVGTGESDNSYVHVQVYENAVFKIGNAGNVVLEYKTHYNLKKDVKAGYTYSLPVLLPEGATDIRTEKYRSGLSHINQVADTVRNYGNYLIYRLNGKYGWACSEKVLPALYDSLLQISVYLNSASRFMFICGIRDEKGLLKFGLTDLYGKGVFPPLYHSIDFSSEFFTVSSRIASNRWIVSADGKYGLISPENAIIIEVAYDSVWRGNKLHEKPIFTLVKKDGLYGVYYLENDGIYGTDLPPVFLPPFSPYKIGNMLFVPKTHEKHHNYYTLLLLVNEKGEKIGYTSKNGIRYFKD